MREREALERLPDDVRSELDELVSCVWNEATGRKIDRAGRIAEQAYRLGVAAAVERGGDEEPRIRWTQPADPEAWPAESLAAQPPTTGEESADAFLAGSRDRGSVAARPPPSTPQRAAVVVQEIWTAWYRHMAEAWSYKKPGDPIISAADQTAFCEISRPLIKRALAAQPEESE